MRYATPYFALSVSLSCISIHFVMEQPGTGIVEKHKYDIALSFLAKDEPVALELLKRLQDRYEVFVYSERQKEIAGKDGEGAFKQVFEKESRLVVVLYRSEWGTTPWTRMEQGGIRDRAYHEGYDFVTFVALEDKPQMPSWFPKQRLYVGHSRFGLDSTAAVIDARAQEVGIESREQTLEEQVQELEQRRIFSAERNAFLNSHGGGQAIAAFWQELHGQLRAKFAEIAASAPTLRIADVSSQQQIGITAEGPALMVTYRQRFINTIEEAKLEVETYAGHPPLFGVQYYGGPPPRAKSMTFVPDRTEDMPLCWAQKGSNYGNAAVAERIVKWWLAQQSSGK